MLAKIFRSFYNKLVKNRYLIITFVLIIITYYFFLFYSILPSYEVSFFNKVNIIIHENSSSKGFLRIENFISDENLENNHFMASINDSILNNKGIIFTIIFHIFFVLFVYSFIKLSLMNPGFLSSQYVDLYNIKQYHDFYQAYVDFVFKKLKSLPCPNKASIASSASLLNSLVAEKTKFQDVEKALNIENRK